jgi:hypothetical protein
MKKTGFSIVGIKYSSIDGAYYKRIKETDFIDRLYQIFVKILFKDTKKYLPPKIYSGFRYTVDLGFVLFMGDVITIFAEKREMNV